MNIAERRIAGYKAAWNVIELTYGQAQAKAHRSAEILAYAIAINLPESILADFRINARAAAVSARFLGRKAVLARRKKK